jgi:hypothetical protein
MKIKKNFIFFGNLKFWMWGKVGDNYSTPHTVSVGWGLSPPTTPQGSNILRILYYAHITLYLHESHRITAYQLKCYGTHHCI